MTSTAAMRSAWQPPCAGNFSTITLHGGGRIRVKTATVPAFLALNECLKRHDYRTRVDQTGAFNCFAAGTPIITRDGWMPIEDALGTQTLLTAEPGHGGPGRWVEAEVEAFGRQEVWEVAVERHGLRRTIRTTANHRWFARPEDGALREVTTAELVPSDGRKGQRLASVKPESVASRTTPSPEGIGAGLVFGDGTIDAQSARVALCGPGRQPLAEWFHPAHRRLTHDGQTVITGLPRSWKNGSPLTEGVHYQYGWLVGYYAATGRLAEGGTPELSGAEPWRLELARTVALNLGIASYPITHVKRTGYGDEPSLVYSLRLDPRSLDSSFFLVDEQRQRWNGDTTKRAADWSVVSVTNTNNVETVYCAVVPDTEAFAIDEFILTGNCRRITGGSGYSLHAYGIAADLNWSANPYGRRLVTDMPQAMISDIKAIRTNNGKQVFRWGGDYRGNKDAMHFEVVCTPSDLATGLRGAATTDHPTDLATFLQQVVACSSNTFRRGDNGACVGVIQRICATKFGHSIAIDGDFGPGTEAAVTAVQRKRGTPDDGIVGPQTWAKMME